MNTRLVSTATGVFALMEVGPPAGEPLLLLHGFPDFPPTFQRLMDRLGEAGFRVAAPYMRGYAPSVREGPYDVEQLAEDGVALANALWPQRRCALLGHDWGAVVAYAALHRSPQRFSRAITMGVPYPLAFLRALPRVPAQLARSAYIFAFQFEGVADRAVAAGDYALIRRLWRVWSPGYRLGQPEWEALRDCLHASMPAPLGYYRALFRPLRQARERIRRFSESPPLLTPVLHLQGAEDGCVAPAACRGQEAYFAGPFESRVLAGAGHFLHVEVPDVVARHVIEWVRTPAG